MTRVVEIDTTGGPAFGMEHFKQYDFLREHEVVLTFDDGPWPENTPAVIKALTDQCVKATFFEIGEHAMWHPELSKMVAAAGMTIGSHTWSHKDLAKEPYASDIEQAKNEIEMGVSAVHAAVAAPIAPFFRFPDLQQPPALLSYLGERNIATFSTDLDSFDFKLHRPEQVIQSVMTKLKKNGKGMVLMHDFQRPDRRGDAGTAASAQGERLQDRAHGAARARGAAAEVRRDGPPAGQAVREQHAAGKQRGAHHQRQLARARRAAARRTASVHEALGPIGRGVAERRRARQHLGDQPAGGRPERQAPMPVAIGEPEPALSRCAPDHRA